MHRITRELLLSFLQFIIVEFVLAFLFRAIFVPNIAKY
jgi:hypothetical protein